MTEQVETQQTTKKPAPRQVRQKALFNSDFEIEGNGVVRQLVMWVRMKTSILGNFDTGPGLKNLLTLLFIKVLGRPLFWLRIRLQSSHGLKARIRALLPRKDSN